MNKLELFLSDLTYNTKFQFLEEAKNKEELLEVAKTRGIKLPAHDLAIFKGIYAYVDRTNRNKCELPREEVEKALDTLAGKAIDFDHMRKKVVGYWIDAKLEKDEIIAYGIFFKGNFKEDYDVIKELMQRDVLAISFEAWGKRELKGDGTYNLRDIEFAGGALLIKEQPAFPGSEVLEMAKDRVLEFAKVMTKPDYFIHQGKELEESRYYMWDTNAILQSLSEVECSSCNEKGTMDVLMMDYENNKAKTKCLYCASEMMVNMTPEAKLTKKGRKIKQVTDLAYKGQIDDINKFISEFEGPETSLEILLEQSVERPTKLTYEQRAELTDEDFAIVANVSLGQDKTKKIRVLPIHDLAHITDVNARLEESQVEALMGKLGVNKDNVKRKMSRRKTHWAMKNLMEKYKKGSASEVIQEVAKASVGRELTVEELEKAQLAVVNLQTLKKGKGGANDTALNKLGDSKDGTANENKDFPTKAPANDTSLQNANVTEDELKAILAEATKKPEATPQTTDKDAEIAQLKTQVSDVSKKLEEATKKLEEYVKKEEDAKKAEVAAKVTARRTELGEFAKDMTDEQILNEDKYELAKVKKENADLKAGKVTAPAKVEEKKPDLATGSTDKDPVKEFQAVRKRVDDMAFGEFSNYDKDDDK